jgi:hypothetical protein
VRTAPDTCHNASPPPTVAHSHCLPPKTLLTAFEITANTAAETFA